jgi:DNA-binding NarL/FixJ family response regulator
MRTLVVSQHDLVRRQLVAYLGRSPALSVAGEPFSIQAILAAAPDIVILDLSQIPDGTLPAAIDAVSRVGARLIALASIDDPMVRDAVLRAGGIYRLKSAGGDGLAEMVRDMAGSGPSSR